MRDDSFEDETLDRALASLPREHAPSPTFTGRLLGELHRRRLVRGPHVRRTWLAAAVAIFAAGIATGVGASLLVVRRAAPLGAVSRVAATATNPPVNVPEVGHSEVWF